MQKEHSFESKIPSIHSFESIIDNIHSFESIIINSKNFKIIIDDILESNFRKVKLIQNNNIIINNVSYKIGGIANIIKSFDIGINYMLTNYSNPLNLNLNQYINLSLSPSLTVIINSLNLISTNTISINLFSNILSSGSFSISNNITLSPTIHQNYLLSDWDSSLLSSLDSRLLNALDYQNL